MRLRPLLLVWLVLGTCLADSRPSARASSVVDLLTRYASGDFQRVVAELASSDVDFDEILKHLRRDGPGWIDAGGPQQRERRELVAATLALEAARADVWNEWKLVQRQPPMCGETGECYQPPSLLYWQAPPLLIEWACARMRALDPPHPAERWWQLAALAVAQRAEDPQFLIGDTHLGQGLGSEEIGNTSDEIKHLEHVRARFKDEPRFLLAEGIVRDSVWPDDALKVYGALQQDVDVGGEALMRLGAMQLRQRRWPQARENLERAETITRDPYVVYLARYFRGQLGERQEDLREAERAYRGAAATVPHAQSATIALAALLFRDGRRDEAQRLVADMLADRVRPADPWREFVHADDRFWPQLIAHLRKEIRP